MTTSLTEVTSALDIPDEPDRGRMYRESGTRLRSAMSDHGVDALILLGNGNVVYATGASWPLLDAGLSHVERPVAMTNVSATMVRPARSRIVMSSAFLSAAASTTMSASARGLRSFATSIPPRGRGLAPRCASRWAREQGIAAIVPEPPAHAARVS